MDTPNDPNQQDRRKTARRLNSWKSIAAYFERDERTVKRWEAQRGLPVHRIPGAGRTSVYAYESELAEWLRSAEAQSALSAPEQEASTEADRPAVPSVTDAAANTSANIDRQSQRRTKMILAFAAAALVFTVFSISAYRRYVSPRPAPASIRPAAVKPSANPEAEDFYLQGLYHWNQRTPEGLNKAVDDFTQSIVRDPNYAPAYVGLANCYNLLREYTLMPAKEAYPRALVAAQRAIALDDSLAEAHNALAFVDFYWSWDVAGAEHEFQRSIALDPNSVVAHHWYATFLMELGRSQEALAEIEKARGLDPHSSAVLADKGLILLLARQTSQATTLLRQIETAEPAFLSPHVYLAMADLKMKEYEDYLREAQTSAVLLRDQNRLAIVTAGEKGFVSSGGEGMLRAMLAVQQDLYAKGHLDAYELATTYCLLRDKEHALHLLQISLANREPGDTSLRVDQLLQSLHNEPAFRKMIAQVGLPSLD
jgi:Tfp pilus assembly protein PilF